MNVQGLLPAGCIEVVESGYSLSTTAGFLVLRRDGVEAGRVPLDDIHALIISAPDAYLSRALIERLMTRGAVVVFCDEKHTPTAITHPYATQYQMARVVKAQLASSTPFCKKLWTKLVRQKILHQARVLECCGREGSRLLMNLAKSVKRGDVGNTEAVAARLYWQRLFGKEFRRDRQLPGTNAALNYGYMVVRASVARAVCGAGLLPFFGIFHHSDLNAFQLVDDLLEPWRPVVDLRVLAMVQEHPIDALTPALKRELVAVLHIDLMAAHGVSPLFQVIRTQATSLAQSFLEKQDNLALARMTSDLFPPPPPPPPPLPPSLPQPPSVSSE